DKNAAAESVGAGTFLLMYNEVVQNRKKYHFPGPISTVDAVTILRATKETMLKNFGKTNISLGEIQKLVRGNVELPLAGLPDVLAPMYSI
ncbi:hypothetical protein, partial [Klebsiella pneumoniae]|uniref:hypothetical protein n=1 Tax=Klebsiella pneumoniae TaxID=573 RepID=UPI001952AA48